MKKWLAILLIAVMTLSLFAACSKKDKLVGTWKTESVIADGRQLSKEEIVENGYNITVTLRKDGTGTATYTRQTYGSWGELLREEPAESELTYDDDNIYLWGETIPYTLNGKTVTAHYTIPFWNTELVITFKKVK